MFCVSSVVSLSLCGVAVNAVDQENNQMGNRVSTGIKTFLNCLLCTHSESLKTNYCLLNLRCFF